MKPTGALWKVREHIAPRLAQLRKQAGLSIRDVQARTGIDNGHISRIEGGMIDVKASTLLVLLDVYDADITDVWPRDGSEGRPMRPVASERDAVSEVHDG